MWVCCCLIVVVRCFLFDGVCAVSVRWCLLCVGVCVLCVIVWRVLNYVFCLR